MEDKTLNKHNLASAALSALSMSLIGANAFAQNDGNMPIDLQTQPVEMEARIAAATLPPPDQPSDISNLTIHFKSILFLPLPLHKT